LSNITDKFVYAILSFLMASLPFIEIPGPQSPFNHLLMPKVANLTICLGTLHRALGLPPTKDYNFIIVKEGGYMRNIPVFKKLWYSVLRDSMALTKAG